MELQGGGLFMKSTKIFWAVLMVLTALSDVSQAADETFIDYFLPMPIQGALTRNA